MAAQDVAITQDLAQSAVDQLVEQLHPQLHDDDAAPNRDAKGFQLYHHWLRRAREIAGPAAVAILFVLASRADNFTGTCYPSVATVSRESGVGIKKVRVILRLLRANGLIGRRTRTLEERYEKPGGKFEYTLLRDDGPRGHIPVTLGWMQKHAGLWRGHVDAYAEIRAIANGKWQFDRNFDKMRIALGCGSRPTFFRLLAALKEHGLVRHYFDDDGECWWELLELKPPDDVPIKRFLAVRQPPVSKLTHTPADPVSKLTACPDAGAAEPVSRLTHGLYKGNPTVGDGIGVVDGVGEVKGELDKIQPTRSTQDQRSAENRAPAAAVPNLALSQDHNQKPEPELDAPIERMLAKLGIKLTTPPEPQPKPKVKSAVQLLREQGWIITSDTDDGWPCAEKPGEHDCCHGLIFARNGRGHESTLRCKVCFDAARMQVVHEQDAEPAATNSGFLEMFIPKLTPPRLPAQRQLTAVPPTIEAECSERKAPKPERDVGDILPPEKLRDYLKWTEVVTDRTMNPGLRTRVTRMFRYGGVARYSAEDYREKLVEVRHEKWELKHGHCHNFGRDPCDGSCGHDQDECDGHVVNLTDAGVLDLVGCAIYSLTGDEHYGRSDDNGCPNAVRERMYAA